jgi:hypothetical protein
MLIGTSRYYTNGPVPKFVRTAARSIRTSECKDHSYPMSLGILDLKFLRLTRRKTVRTSNPPHQFEISGWFRPALLWMVETASLEAPFSHGR